MDKDQETTPSQPGVDTPKNMPEKFEPATPTERAALSKGIAAIGKTKNLLKNAAPPVPGAEDTGTFKAVTLPQDGPIELPDAARDESAHKNDTLVIPNAGRMLPPPRREAESTETLATYRRWLEDRSKNELIEMILDLEDQKPGLQITQKMINVQVSEPSSIPSEGYKIPDDLTYVRLPVLRKTPVNEPTPTWQIVLICLDQTAKPIGLRIDSEITVGRAAGDTTPDLDLTSFGAKNKGVSRIHGRLRPLMNKLYLIDSNSSNGTYWNRMLISSQTEQPLNDGDVIAFGRANFLVKIIKAPDPKETKTII